MTTVQSIADSISGGIQGDQVVPLPRRAELCEECIESVQRVAERWAELGAEAKGCGDRPEIIAEELLAGPVIVIRFLRLAQLTLRQLFEFGKPTLPGTPKMGDAGCVEVPIVPTRGLFDSIIFLGLRGRVRMQPEITIEEIHGDLLRQACESSVGLTTAVLGAGNVSSVPATDSLDRMLFQGRHVILKMNPVNSYLLPVFEAAFAPLIREGLFSLLTGDALLGRELIHHPAIHDVHITGSIESHDRIVWGDDAQTQARQKTLGIPLLEKPVTSELGNVTPWIIVPGEYTARELDSQAQHLAASITNNAAFNCLATRVVLSWKNWPQRADFLQRLQGFLERTPRRPAYYPGALERYRRFLGKHVDPDHAGRLPWALLTAQSIRERPELFGEESFACVCAETTLDGECPEEFLERAVEFVNDQVAGSLCASITFPNKFQTSNRSAYERALRQLRYATICVNQWSGLAYSLISPPWGGYPGSTLDCAGSGRGAVHNTYLLERFEKSILQGPLVNFPRPAWFASHRNPLATARALLHLYARPQLTRLPRLFSAALRG